MSDDARSEGIARTIASPCKYNAAAAISFERMRSDATTAPVASAVCRSAALSRATARVTNRSPRSLSGLNARAATRCTPG